MSGARSRSEKEGFSGFDVGDEAVLVFFPVVTARVVVEGDIGLFSSIDAFFFS